MGLPDRLWGHVVQSLFSLLSENRSCSHYRKVLQKRGAGDLWEEKKAPARGVGGPPTPLPAYRAPAKI